MFCTPNVRRVSGIADSSSINAVSFSSARTTKRFRHGRSVTTLHPPRTRELPFPVPETPVNFSSAWTTKRFPSLGAFWRQQQQDIVTDSQHTGPSHAQRPEPTVEIAPSQGKENVPVLRSACPPRLKVPVAFAKRPVPQSITVVHMMRRAAFDTRPHPTNIHAQVMKRLFHCKDCADDSCFHLI